MEDTDECCAADFPFLLLVGIEPLKRSSRLKEERFESRSEAEEVDGAWGDKV